MNGETGERTKPAVCLGVRINIWPDRGGRPVRVSAMDEDEEKIREIADRLQRAGYGILRERNPRAGRIFHRLDAQWAGPGEPPADPLDADSPTPRRNR